MKRLLAAVILLACLTLLFSTPDSPANPLYLGYFELANHPYDLAIPGTGSEWALVSAVDQADVGWSVIQASYEDNGDGVISTGDKILGPENNGHDLITVASVRHLYRLDENGWVLRPLLENGGNLVCETWEVLQPAGDWGTTVHVDDWSGLPSAPAVVGEQVNLDGTWYTISQTSLVVEGTHAVPVRPTTWGKIKTFFGELL